MKEKQPMMSYDTCLSLFVLSVIHIYHVYHHIYKCRNTSFNCVTLSKVVSEVNKIYR
jgi:hypothetical protein